MINIFKNNPYLNSETVIWMRGTGSRFDEDTMSLKYYKRIGYIKQFKYYFKMIDMYALPITLRYKNQRKFYTNFGALASLTIFLVLL